MKLSSLLASNDQKQIEQTLQNRFASNLAFFSQIHPKLYKQLLLPPQKYNLFFDQDGINLIDLTHQTLLYPKEEKSHSFLSTHLNLAHSPLQNSKWQLFNNHLYLQKLNPDTFPITAQAINAFIDSLEQLGGIASFHLPSSFLPSTCIFGALGGLFVQFLLEEGIFFHAFLWFEEEIDFFRIACFFVDFPLLFKRCSKQSCYLFIQDLINRNLIKHYFETHKITNNFLRLELSMYHSPKITQAKAMIQEMYAQNSRGWGSFEDECIGLQNTLYNLSSHRPILSSPRRIDIPFCVVGNGSSLNSLLPFIQANQDKMIILSCGTALKVLKDYGIYPDFQIEIERINYLDEVLKTAPLGDTPLICGNMVSPSALSLAKEAYLFMRGGNSSAYLLPSFVLELSSPFVGNAGVAMACAFGSDVILCGMDCGYIQGQSKHAKGSYYGEETTKIPKDAFKVEGNGEKEVYSTSIYALSASMMGLAIAHFKPNIVLNLGDGAYIQNSKSAKPKDFVLKAKNKRKAIEAFKASFQTRLDISNLKSPHLDSPDRNTPALNAPALSMSAVLDMPILNTRTLNAHALNTPDLENPTLESSLNAPDLDAPILDTPADLSMPPILDTHALNTPTLSMPALNASSSPDALSEYFHAFSQFIEELKRHFQTPISSKPELFALIDSIHQLCRAKSASKPSIGILLEGSICHLLQNLMMCALHYPHHDITPLYARCLDWIFIALDKYKLKLRLLLQLSQNQ